MIRALKDFELVIDSFAGGGGAGHGIRRALGRAADLAINHDEQAIAMYAENHPDTLTMTEDVWKVGPREATGGKAVGLLWASPDCKHFSRAKGSKPVNKNIRSLAWVVVKWADQIRPRVIILENVREFAEWGPVVPAWRCKACSWRGAEGQATLVRTRRRCPRCESIRLDETAELIPDPDRKGVTFRRWTNKLKRLGYVVEFRNLNAADYGAPTHRRRLFLIARCDGKPIVWPDATHGDPKKLGDQPLFERLRPWRTAAECIDWSLACPSIFDRKKPLAEATMRRIAMGIKRYVLDNPQPFIVGVGGRMGQTPAAGVDQPSNTITAKNDRALVVPHLVSVAHSTTTGRGKYFDSVEEPLKTVTQSNDKALVTPYLVPMTHGGERRPNSIEEPLPTITTAHRGEIGLIAPVLTRQFGNSIGQRVDQPSPTQTCGEKTALVAAFLAKHFGGVVGHVPDRPLGTVTTIDHHSLVAANLIRMNHGDKQWNGVNEPLVTQTTANHAALVYSFLIRYFGTAIGQSVTEPLFTITGKDRFGLVTVSIDGELYVIVDIGMRMLAPRELARAQGFDDSYKLTGTKTSQVARIGNSVPPVMAEVLVNANYVTEAACQ